MFSVYGEQNNEYFEKRMLKIENSGSFIFKLICELKKNGSWTQKKEWKNIILKPNVTRRNSKD